MAPFRRAQSAAIGVHKRWQRRGSVLAFSAADAPATVGAPREREQAALGSQLRDNFRAILVRPREPFFQWLHETGVHTPTSIEKRRARIDVVLVAREAARTDEDLHGTLLRSIAERQLADACPDRSRWPAFASLDNLADWFTCLPDVDVWELPGE